jgi:hypothetical protein
VPVGHARGAVGHHLASARRRSAGDDREDDDADEHEEGEDTHGFQETRPSTWQSRSGRIPAAPSGIAEAALAFAAVALGFGLYGLLPVLGFVLSLIGLVRGQGLERKGVQQTGFGQSLAGLLLSIIGIAQWVPFLLQVVPGLPGLPTPLPS